jgi:2-aminoadipate transaminase
MNIIISRKLSSPIYMQIKQQIREAIFSGQLPAGYLLPPERKLAEQLGINRSTVLNAYIELKAEGLIESFVGKGTVVLPISKSDSWADSSRIAHYGAPSWRHIFSERSLGSDDPLIRDLLSLPKRRDCISFSVALPDPGPELTAKLSEQLQALMQEQGDVMWKHTATEGILSLREALCTWMKQRGIDAAPEEVLALSGSQQGIDLLTRVFIDPGDTVLIEEPSYFSAMQTFRSAGARLIGIPADSEGQLRLDILESMLSKYHPKLIYVLPTFQNPTGRVMNLAVREQLLQLAYRYKTIIVEDDPYSDFRYSGNPLPPIRALDRHDHVIYVSTFSKLIGSGLRMGWLNAPKQVIRQLAIAKQMADLHTSTLSQVLMERMICSGLLHQHVDLIRSRYKHRKQLMIDSLHKHYVPGMTWQEPEGGVFIWCRMPKGLNANELLLRAADRGVDYLPGNPFFAQQQQTAYVRLNFSCAEADTIDEGIRRFTAAVRDATGREGLWDEAASEGLKPII